MRSVFRGIRDKMETAKGVSMSRYTIAVATLVLGIAFLLSPNTSAFNLGGGVEFTSGIGLQGVAAARFGAIGFQGGVAMASRSEAVGEGAELTVSAAYISLLLKYYLQMGALPVSGYAGAGLIGAAIDLSGSQNGTSVDIFSGTATGQQALAGVEFQMPNFPAVLYGGVTYLNFSELEVELFGITTSVPVAASGFAFHAGARLEFAIGGGAEKKKAEEEMEQ